MVHIFSMNDHYIAVDGNSGSVHTLDELSYHILKGLQMLTPLDDIYDRLSVTYTPAEVQEAYNEIKSLKEEGLLFSSDHLIAQAIAAHQQGESIKALCLHVSHDCNLSCEYCFAAKGDYNSGRKLMTREVAFKAVDFLVEHSGNRQSIEIDFFGGEPLMNMELVKETVAYGRQLEGRSGKKFYFTITTNGTLLD